MWATLEGPVGWGGVGTELSLGSLPGCKEGWWPEVLLCAMPPPCPHVSPFPCPASTQGEFQPPPCSVGLGLLALPAPALVPRPGALHICFPGGAAPFLPSSCPLLFPWGPAGALGHSGLVPGASPAFPASSLLVHLGDSRGWAPSPQAPATPSWVTWVERLSPVLSLAWPRPGCYRQWVNLNQQVEDLCRCINKSKERNLQGFCMLTKMLSLPVEEKLRIVLVGLEP